MRIYLDNCCYNRHHDKKVSDEIVADKNAVIAIQKEIIKKNIELATSFMLHYENNQNSNLRNRNYNDFFMRNYRTIYVGVDNLEELKPEVEKMLAAGIKIKDAYHIASAIVADCDYFVTVDKKLLKYISKEVKIVSPTEFVKIMAESDCYDERRID
ncbi:MAG: hypothetical protein J5809_07700 [Selenomonadaceae bacterium]|nr:hypothetical protein [Selenomonadaceae bacterium]